MYLLFGGTFDSLVYLPDGKRTRTRRLSANVELAGQRIHAKRKGQATHCARQRALQLTQHLHLHPIEGLVRSTRINLEMYKSITDGDMFRMVKGNI